MFDILKKKSDDKLEIQLEDVIKPIEATKEYEWELSDEGYFIAKLLDYNIRHIDERGIQRILRDVDNNDLCIALKGLSIEAQNKIYNNLSKRLANMLIEDGEFMGPVRLVDVAEAMTKLMRIIVKLMSLSIIQDDEYHIVSRMTELFGVDAEKINSDEKCLAIESELEQLFERYKNVRRKTI